MALQAQYIYDTFGKFPGTVPSMFLIMHVQAHHLDLDFYDEFCKPGAYLKTHANHITRWHPEKRQAETIRTEVEKETKAFYRPRYRSVPNRSVQ